MSADANLRRRIGELQTDIADERQREIARAIEYKDVGDPQRAAYHTGLADGANSTLVTLGHLTREFPADAVKQRGSRQ